MLTMMLNGKDSTMEPTATGQQLMIYQKLENLCKHDVGGKLIWGKLACKEKMQELQKKGYKATVDELKAMKSFSFMLSNDEKVWLESVMKKVTAGVSSGNLMQQLKKKRTSSGSSKAAQDLCFFKLSLK